MSQYFLSNSGSSHYDNIICLESYVQVRMRRCNFYVLYANARGSVARGDGAPVALGSARP